MDCGQRTYKTRNAAMLPQLRIAIDTLEDLMTNPTPAEARNARGVWFVLAFTIPGPTALYRKCMITELAPPFPVFLGFNVRTLHALKTLEEGETHKISWDRTGSCVDHTPETIVACAFGIELDLFVSRLARGESIN
jgi:hypothetical protein